MLFDTSYSDKKITKAIDSAVGKPYSFKARWKLGGIGSKRMVIKSISEEYQKHLKSDIYETKANIELRPKGLIIHFRDKLQTMTWVVPFIGIKIQSENDLEITSQGKFIQFDKESIDKKFVEKVINRINSE